MNQVAVYRSRNSRCCILVSEDKKYVQFISIDEGDGDLSIDVRKMDAREFHEEYRELDSYPVLRAVDHLLNPITAAITITDRANKYLNQLRADKGIAMQDQNRRTLAERNVIATHKAGLPKAGPVPPVSPCQVIEHVPGSSQKPKKGTWDRKTSPTESNDDALRSVVRKYKAEKTKAAKKAARQEKRKKRMTEQQNEAVNTEANNDAAQQPQEKQQATKKPAAKKAEPKAKPTKPAAKKAVTKKPATKEATNTTAKEKTVTKKTEAAKKTTAKKTATKAPAKKAAPEKASKLTKGTGKKAAAATKAPAKKAAGKAQKKQDGGARRGRKGAFDESQKIKLLTKDNPKREGTAAYDTFETLRKSKTVGEFFAAGGSSASLHWNIERGYIQVV